MFKPTTTAAIFFPPPLSPDRYEGLCSPILGDNQAIFREYVLFHLISHAVNFSNLTQNSNLEIVLSNLLIFSFYILVSEACNFSHELWIDKFSQLKKKNKKKENDYNLITRL